MRMRRNDRDNVLALFREETDVGHNEIDTWRSGFASEQNAAIDNDPLAVIWRTVAIGVEIHADLSRTAKRQEDQLIVTIGCDHSAGGFAFARSALRA